MSIKKGVLSVFLSILMLLSMAVPAVAADATQPAAEPKTFNIGFDLKGGSCQHLPAGQQTPLPLEGEGVILRTTLVDDNIFSAVHGSQFVYDPVYNNDANEFEGWLKYQFHPAAQPMGSFMTVENGKLYSTTEVLGMEYDSDIIWVAKWKSVDFATVYANYTTRFPEDDPSTSGLIDVSFVADGATICIDRPYTEGTTSGYHHEVAQDKLPLGGFAPGTTLAAKGFVATTGKETPVFNSLNGKTRTFQCWMPCVWRQVPDESDQGYTETWVPIDSTLQSLTDMQAALNYTLPNENMAFVAQWAEPDEDFYSDCNLHTAGGTLPIENGGQVGGMTMTGGRLLEGAPVTLPLDVTRSVTHPNDTFTGYWYKGTFALDANGNDVYTVDTTQKYTYDEIVKTDDNDTVYHTVPADNVVYMPVWQNMPTALYNALNEEGVTVLFDVFEGVLLKKGETEPVQQLMLEGVDTLKLSDLYPSDIIASITPEQQGTPFEGWLKAVRVNGEATLSTTPITTAQALAYTCNAGEEVEFIAKWSNIPLGEYARRYASFEDELAACIDLYGGSATHRPAREPQAITLDGSVNFNGLKGYTTADMMGPEVLTNITAPANSGATLQGWLTYTQGTDGTYSLKSDTLITGDITQVSLSENVVFVAKWSHIDMLQYREYHPEGAPAPAQIASFYLSAEDASIEMTQTFDDGTTDIQTGIIFEIGVEQGQSINDVAEEMGINIVITPVKDRYNFAGWDIYQLDEETVSWESVPAGSTPAVNSSNPLVVHVGGDESGQINTYLVANTYQKVKSNATTAQLLAFEQTNLLYVAKATWQASLQVEVEQTMPNTQPGDTHMLSLQNDIQLPEDPILQQAFPSADAIKEALEEVLQQGAGSQLETEFMEIKLMVKRAGSNEWEEVTANNFPSEGLDVYIPLPSGTSAGSHHFTVAHLSSLTGQIEVLPCEVTADGLKVRVNSLSPFAVSYEPIGNSGSAGGATAAPSTPAAPVRTNPKTGVQF